MDFIKDFINTLSAASISFLLLSSIFAFIVYFSLLDGRLKSKVGGAFAAFGVLLIVVGFAIRPLLFLGIAYLALMFVIAHLGPRVWDTKIGLWMFIIGGAAFGVSMIDPNFYLIAAKPDNVPIVAMIFLLGFFTWVA